MWMHDLAEGQAVGRLDRALDSGPGLRECGPRFVE
jgi:hypothetical protein